MAKEEKTLVTEPSTPVPAPPAVPKTTEKTWRSIPPMGWLAAGAVVLLLLAIGVFCAVRASHQRGVMQLGMERGAFDRQRDNGPMMHGRSGERMNSGTSQSGTVLSGVVTAVDGSTLTVAGRGKAVKVITNSSTTYTGGAVPVSVNDSVRVTTNGSSSDGSYTAVSVAIGRQ